MTSAFEALKLRPTHQPSPSSVEGFSAEQRTWQDERPVMDSETEDEEVKLNCIGGFRGILDSDMNTTASSDNDISADDSDDEDDRSFSAPRVVTFVTNHIPVRSPVVRPVVAVANGRELSPHLEVDSESDASSVSSAGARGIALSLGSPSAASDTSVQDSGSSEDDEETSWGDDEGGEEDLENGPAFEMDEDESDEEDRAEKELSLILSNLGEQRLQLPAEELDSSERFLGVMRDREDLITIPKTKRVLSYNTLTALSVDSGREDSSSKRLKTVEDDSIEATTLLSVASLMTPFQTRIESLVISSDEEDLDRQLGEELDQNCKEINRENTPVPLLTPPQSPLTIDVDGDETTVCEWPSNLAVDSAITAVSELRPMSPASLLIIEKLNLGESRAISPHDVDGLSFGSALQSIIVE